MHIYERVNKVHRVTWYLLPLGWIPSPSLPCGSHKWGQPDHHYLTLWSHEVLAPSPQPG